MKLADLAHALGAELLGPALHASPPPDSEASSAAPPTHRIPAQEGHYASTDILGVAGIEDAQPHQLTFVANPKYVALAQTTRAGAILVEPGFPAVPLPTLRLSDPYYAFARALELFYQPPSYPPGIHATAVVDPSAIIGDNVHIGPFAVVGPDVVLGADSVLLAHVVLYPGAHIGKHFFAHAHAVVREHCILGDHVTLQNGAIIGADGFGFAKSPRRSPDNNPGPCSNAHAENASDGNLNASPARGQAHSQQASALPGENRGAWFKIPQSGPVILEDWVEVQAHACIDRASVGETRIGRGAKIDNLVQVGHGSTVGAGTLLCAQVGLAGSSHIGNNVILAGQVGVAGHCTIGDGAIATAQSGIPGDVAPGAIVSGYPAIDNRRWLKASAIFQRLPETLRKLQKARKSEEA